MKRNTQDSTPRVSATQEEKSRLAKLVEQFEEFDRQIVEVELHFADARHNQAQLDYLANPISETFKALKNANIELGMISNSTLSSSVLAVVQGAQQSFAQKIFHPFVGPILARVLSAYHSQLKEVTDRDTKQHFEMFGTHIVSSVSMAEATARVNKVEALVALIEKVMPFSQEEIEAGAKFRIPGALTLPSVKEVASFIEQLPTEIGET